MRGLQGELNKSLLTLWVRKIESTAEERRRDILLSVGLSGQFFTDALPQELWVERLQLLDFWYQGLT